MDKKDLFTLTFAVDTKQAVKDLKDLQSNLVTLDKRDLFDWVRGAVRYAMLDQGSREDDGELWGDVTERTERCLSELYSLPHNDPNVPPKRITMADVMRAFQAVSLAPMMTSNQCHAIAQQLNAFTISPLLHRIELLESDAENAIEANTAIRAERDEYLRVIAGLLHDFDDGVNGGHEAPSEALNYARTLCAPLELEVKS